MFFEEFTENREAGDCRNQRGIKRRALRNVFHAWGRDYRFDWVEKVVGLLGTKL